METINKTQDNETTLKKVELERQLCSGYFTIADLDELWFSEAEKQLSIRSNQCIYTIKTFIAAQQLERLQAMYPIDWWQAVKQRFFPKWLAKKYPIKYKYIRLEARALYPRVAIPNEKHGIVLMDLSTED